ncbi:MAG TPA: hypothetical protein PK205_17035 [Promineifilum sp.]|nr:hypothetical protein [Promineifilum sp.]HRO91330.1 hypothetical protein [Promineifilum sp.]HRQ15010.1 hypothetical protein [Promineifilum sp.]
MGLELLCAVVIALGFGVLVAFSGYRLFLSLLPIWGFFFGFVLGTQTIQALIGDGMFATATSWVVGFVVALVFAVLSYLFYFWAVAVVAGSLGYGVGVGLMNLIGLDFALIPWIVGIILGAVLIVVTFRYNLAKVVIIAATAVGGAALAIGTLALGPGNVSLGSAFNNPVQAVLGLGFLWAILFVIMAAAGFYVQWQANRAWTAEPYPNRI